MKTKLANKWKKRKQNKENKTKQTIKCFFMSDLLGKMWFWDEESPLKYYQKINCPEMLRI